MSPKPIDRVIELWPRLSDQARAESVDLADGAVALQPPLRNLTTYEEKIIEQSIKDFRHGRVMNSDEYRLHMGEFYRGLGAKAAS